MTKRGLCMKSKYAKQLSLAIDSTEQTQKELADKLFVSPSGISKYRRGQRTVDREKKKSFLSVLKKLRLAYSSAREDYGIISFSSDDNVRDDLFALTVAAKKEEQERINAEIDFNTSASRPMPKRTSVDRTNINLFLKESAEEIGAEITKFIADCDYAGVDPQPFIDTFNEHQGG